MRIQRPNNTQGPTQDLSQFTNAYRLISVERAQRHWEFWHAHTGEKGGCMHGFNCNK